MVGRRRSACVCVCVSARQSVGSSCLVLGLSQRAAQQAERVTSVPVQHQQPHEQQREPHAHTRM